MKLQSIVLHYALHQLVDFSLLYILDNSTTHIVFVNIINHVLHGYFICGWCDTLVIGQMEEGFVGCPERVVQLLLVFQLKVNKRVTPIFITWHTRLSPS